MDIEITIEEKTSGYLVNIEKKNNWHQDDDEKHAISSLSELLEIINGYCDRQADREAWREQEKCEAKAADKQEKCEEKAAAKAVEP